MRVRVSVCVVLWALLLLMLCVRVGERGLAREKVPVSVTVYHQNGAAQVCDTQA